MSPHHTGRLLLSSGGALRGRVETPSGCSFNFEIPTVYFLEEKQVPDTVLSDMKLLWKYYYEDISLRATFFVIVEGFCALEMSGKKDIIKELRVRFVFFSFFYMSE